MIGAVQDVLAFLVGTATAGMVAAATVQGTLALIESIEAEIYVFFGGERP